MQRRQDFESNVQWFESHQVARGRLAGRQCTFSEMIEMIVVDIDMFG
jgi:hypothetical protein